VVENMGYFTCPHCHHEIDIFSKGGGERTAAQFGLPFLGMIELAPEIRKGGDQGSPVALAGPDDPHAKSFYDFAQKVKTRLAEVQAAAGEGVIQIQ
jgi:ATP-binding protein involved in chromosome partitioning